MYEGTIGEIRMFAGPYAPRNWAFCYGQILSINQNQALFSILGAMYGGNGVTTFALPDFRGRIPVGFSNEISLGKTAGEETHALTSTEMPAHLHLVEIKGNHFKVSAKGATQARITSGSSLAAPVESRGRMKVPTQGFVQTEPNVGLNSNSVDLGDVTLEPQGGNQGHENRMPSLGMNYVICLFGIYPSRN
ncbi:phage tail protein [Empedobacter falsenii]|uniref:Phage tail protein n=3 Tax=Weeksellaceae TaxID=2762318 RepID=A0A7H9DQ82_9FLAO|nr:tail fiber protein [uncultured Empedobacter sp.]QLL57200.1 phage tail protein [Empedobacter falsenii]